MRADPTPDAVRERVGLAPVSGLLERLGDPHHRLPCVHVAGSKGKGTTVLLAERLARAAGLHTGSYTSPHLRRWAERLRIDCAPVDDRVLASLIERVRGPAEAMADGPAGPGPSFFDVLTAAALLHFAEARVDLAVLETGLGGRLDATNVVTPLACCITTIELEHTDRLGTTHGAIAGEKAGIIKPGVPLVLGRVAGEARDVILARARALDAPVLALGEAIRIESQRGGTSRIVVDTGERRVETVSRRTGVMADNAALALALAALVESVAPGPLAKVARTVLGEARVEGRLDVLGERPLRVVDAAHTARSAAELAALLTSLGRDDWHLVLSATGGKDLDAILRPLLPHAAAIVTTRADPTRSIAAGELAHVVRALRPEIDVTVLDQPREALEHALAQATPDGAVCAAGSVYLAGVAIDVLGRP